MPALQPLMVLLVFICHIAINKTNDSFCYIPDMLHFGWKVTLAFSDDARKAVSKCSDLDAVVLEDGK